MKNNIKNKVLTSLLIALTVLLPLSLSSCAEEHEHEWGEWETYIESTCFVVGQERSSCRICGEERFRELPSAHKFENPENDYENKRTVLTCSICGTTEEHELTSEDAGVPIVTITGSLSGISTVNRVTVDIDYDSPGNSFSAKAAIKIQGSTSTVYEKKNYSVKFKTDDGDKLKVKILDEWGKHSKYCLKANYIDYTQLRNIVSAKLYGQIAKTRDKKDTISGLTNGGAIDGFPVALYLNGKFHGLYTFNTPKDEYVLGLNDDTARQALVMANKSNKETKLQNLADEFKEGSFELEYSSTEEISSVGNGWVLDSLNEMITFLNENDGEAFREGVGEYIDVDRAIDEMLFTFAIGASDNDSGNILWATYDGKVWVPSPYDLDATWGLSWNGKEFIDPPVMNIGNFHNVLWQRLLDNFHDEIKERWHELRQSVLTLDNIEALFKDFDSMFPEDLRAAEDKRWDSVPNKEGNTIEQIIAHASSELYILDEYFK